MEGLGEAVRADVKAKLFDGDADEIVLGFDRPNITLAVEPKRESTQQLLSFLGARKGQSGIVYCLSRKKTEATAQTLNEHGIRALAYHAGMEKEQREANQNVFMTERAIVMVATIAFGMGIDKSDVRFVFHADLPGSVEAYYQEIGRAGRDGAAAEAHMLFGLGDIRMRRMFIDQEESNDDRKRREHQRLNALIGYCEASGCRRQILLGYFGETAEPCGNCDLCRSPASLVDATAEAWLVLEAIRTTGERYGAVHIANVLRGMHSDKVASARHDQLAAFGSGTMHSVAEWQAMMRQLVAGGFLDLDIAGYGGLAISAKGRALLTGKETFSHRPLAKPEKRTKKQARAEMADASDADKGLLAALKELRLKLAKQRRVPAYAIFPDRTLIEMAERRPQSLGELAQINGVGEKKLQAFGETFLRVIAGH